MVRAIATVLARELRVEGPSMLPTLVPGESVVAYRRWRPLRVGDVVALRDPRNRERWLIKRVAALSRAGVEVRGDNEKYSEDSRAFGMVSRRAITWVVPPSSLRH